MGIETENNSNRASTTTFIFTIVVNYLLARGPYRVPFLLNLPDATESHLVIGELYIVLRQGLSRLDELEGMSRDHYERLLIRVCRMRRSSVV
ncbi:gamma-glutamylcyclotransferase [Populus alba x Populus x berolinensis]|nr:gamma-glutamylcyclotransferase [Populus alba x Populus x berolinensis]